MLLWYNKQIRERKLLKRDETKTRKNSFCCCCCTVWNFVWQTNWASVNHRPGRRNYNVLGQRLVVHKKKTGPPLIIVVEFYLANNPPRLKKKNSQKIKTFFDLRTQGPFYFSYYLQTRRLWRRGGIKKFKKKGGGWPSAQNLLTNTCGRSSTQHKLLFIWEIFSSSFSSFSPSCLKGAWNGPKGSQKPRKRFSHGWAEPRLQQLSTGHTHTHLILILSDLILNHRWAVSPRNFSKFLGRRTNFRRKTFSASTPSSAIRIPPFNPIWTSSNLKKKKNSLGWQTVRV